MNNHSRSNRNAGTGPPTQSVLKRFNFFLILWFDSIICFRIAVFLLMLIKLAK
ncbi:hypothetical protein Hanom_Chr05g00393421 [Helianthus anomalus]